MVDIETAQNEYVKFNCEQRKDGKWCAVAQMQKALDKPFVVIPVKIIPKEFPEKARTVLMVLRQKGATTNPEMPSPPFTAKCWAREPAATVR